MADILAALDELEAKEPKTKKKSSFKPTNTKFRNPLTNQNQQFVPILQAWFQFNSLTEATLQSSTSRTQPLSPNLSTNISLPRIAQIS